MRQCEFWDDPQVQERVVHNLKQEQLILGTSDTVLGLLAPLTKSGFERLNEVKTRFEKPYIILAGRIENVELFTKCFQGEKLRKMIAACWPGPLTIILNALPSLPAYLCSKERTVAIRVPKHQGLQSILPHFPGLFSTSANISGEPVPRKLAEVSPAILESVAMVVTDRKESAQMVPSTILDCTQSIPRVIREGAYAIEDLENIFGQAFSR